MRRLVIIALAACAPPTEPPEPEPGLDTTAGTEAGDESSTGEPGCHIDPVSLWCNCPPIQQVDPESCKCSVDSEGKCFCGDVLWPMGACIPTP